MYVSKKWNITPLSVFLAGGVDSTPPPHKSGINMPSLIGLKYITDDVNIMTGTRRTRRTRRTRKTRRTQRTRRPRRTRRTQRMQRTPRTQREGDPPRSYGNVTFPEYSSPDSANWVRCSCWSPSCLDGRASWGLIGNTPMTCFNVVLSSE